MGLHSVLSNNVRSFIWPIENNRQHRGEGKKDVQGCAGATTFLQFMMRVFHRCLGASRYVFERAASRQSSKHHGPTTGLPEGVRPIGLRSAQMEKAHLEGVLRGPALTSGAGWGI